MANLGPQSPLEIKPDTATLLSYANGNRTGSPESPGLSQSSFGLPHNGFGQNNQQAFPPNHPLSGSKHLCSICGDRASGKHYGVYSCEGCKGFFKRTVRKDLTYACREDRQCIIDKRQRNRCQYCRYQKCLEMGMKREAVQEERQRNRADRTGDNEVESTSSNQYDVSIERIVEAEQRCDGREDQLVAFENGNTDMVQASDKQLYILVDWAKHIPHFAELPLEDQVTLLKSGWNELLIAGLSHRSVVLNDGIVLATGLVIDRRSARSAGFENIYDRVLTELVAKFREMRIDMAELGCLKAIVLLNPDAKGLKSVEKVEKIREQIYMILEEHCRSVHPEEPGRFAKLLIRLPSLRSVGLKCLDYLFFFHMSSQTSIDQFLSEMLEAPIMET